jgi:predicted RNA binding protein YcfA (HicA-like mRNA interferase family)
MCSIHTVSSTELIRDLKVVGWELDRIRGSHHVFVHPIRPGIVVVPHPCRDLGKGLVASIRRQAGLE